MRKLSTIIACLTFVSTIGWAQSGMTDNQIMDYVIEQNAKGVSRQQIVTQLMQRGVTIDQLRRIQKKYQMQANGDMLGAEDITNATQSNKIPAYSTLIFQMSLIDFAPVGTVMPAWN